MTAKQKNIIKALFQQGNIAPANGQYRLRDDKHNPVLKFTYQTFKEIKHLLRKDKPGILVIDLRKVRQQHGKSWVKRFYKEQLKDK